MPNDMLPLPALETLNGRNAADVVAVQRMVGQLVSSQDFQKAIAVK